VSIATVVATVAGSVGVLLTGLAAVVTAMRTAPRSVDPQTPVPHAGSGDPRSPGSAVPASGGKQAAGLAHWTLALGVLAWLIAIAIVLVSGLSTAPLSGAPVRTLGWATIGLAVLAIGTGGVGVQRSIAVGPGQARLLRTGAGLALATAALAATLIAGT
jgi:hypothetical protein